MEIRQVIDARPQRLERLPGGFVDLPRQPAEAFACHQEISELLRAGKARRDLKELKDRVHAAFEVSEVVAFQDKVVDIPGRWWFLGSSGSDRET